MLFALDDHGVAQPVPPTRNPHQGVCVNVEDYDDDDDDDVSSIIDKGYMTPAHDDDDNTDTANKARNSDRKSIHVLNLSATFKSKYWLRSKDPDDDDYESDTEAGGFSRGNTL